MDLSLISGPSTERYSLKLHRMVHQCGSSQLEISMSFEIIPGKLSDLFINSINMIRIVREKENLA